VWCVCERENKRERERERVCVGAQVGMRNWAQPVEVHHWCVCVYSLVWSY
jgi:hypothetical protein